MWIKCLSAAACLALVVLVGVSSGLFGVTSSSGADSAGETTDMLFGAVAESDSYADDEAGKDVAYGDAGDRAAAAPQYTDAKIAYFTSANGDTYYVEDSDGLEKLKALMTPLTDVKRTPQGEPDYSLSFDCGDELIVMELYIGDDAVFADSGDGPYAVAGSPDEITAFIK